MLADVVVEVRCHLCRPHADGLIVTTTRAWWDAVDHALDEHRAQLVAAPNDTQRAFTVSDVRGVVTPLRKPLKGNP